MKLSSIRSAEKRAKLMAQLSKKAWSLLESPADTQPVFIVGPQRSGTTMLMDVFHLHPDTDVFDEARRSPVYLDFRVRSIATLKDSIDRSTKRFACYKIICDSHILPIFLEALPSAKVIWSYRGVTDNANSALKKFPHATRAIRLVCDGKPGGGWFAEGVSAEVAAVLRALPLTELSELDYACLAWWARNHLFFELGVEKLAQVRLLRYESLVQEPVDVLRRLFEWVGLSWSNPVCRFIHSRSVRQTDLSRLHPAVASLCGDLEQRLDAVNAAQWGGVSPTLLEAQDWRPHGDSNPGYRRERAMS
jgi:sulfotransferase family protein